MTSGIVRHGGIMETAEELEDISGILKTHHPCFTHNQPFIFKANAGDVAWSPLELRRRLGIRDFGKLAHIIVLVTGQNDDEVNDLTAQWTELGYNVILKTPITKYRPIVGNEDSHYVFGIRAEVAYAKSDGFWRATRLLKKALLAAFSDNKKVLVNCNG